MGRWWLAMLIAMMGAALSATPYDGFYAPMGVSCDAHLQDEEIGGPILLANDLLVSGSSCRLSNPVEVRDLDAHLYDAECAAEGDIRQTRIMLLRHGDTGLVVIRDWAVEIGRYCENSDERIRAYFGNRLAAPASRDTVILRDCLATRSGDIGWQAACYADQHQACMDASQGITVHMSECTGRALQIWDDELNAIWADLDEAMPRAAFEELRVEQRAWISRRDEGCLAEAEEVRGGTLFPVILNRCMMRRTALRSAELFSLLERHR